ncbi:serine/threonine-protein kinase [Streptomyces sp. NPDC056987]|uniref:serine/threonine-protein kinase n=1 Tax=Streptomyces sp. NPDC056987 TaxID=3345988 RepID=UPI0036274B0A
MESLEPLDAQDPRRVGEFRILGRLGEGGMGRVYLARSPGGRAVAVKFIHADMAATPGFRDRFRREVDVVQRVAGVAGAAGAHGAGTVPVVAAGVDERHPWYASDYVPGPSVQEAVDRFGPLPEETLWRFAADLAKTLRHIHAESLIHRDLKPSNVLLSSAGPRLIDFGIVHAALESALTISGARIGTPAFMSPEQAYGERVTPATDIYSYGLTLAFAATGQVSRRASQEVDLGDVDAQLRLLILNCLDPEPERRPSAAEVHSRAAAMDRTTDTWLPAPIASAIASTSERLLNLESRDEGADGGHGHPGTVRDEFHHARTPGPQSPPPPAYGPPPHGAPYSPPPNAPHNAPHTVGAYGQPLYGSPTPPMYGPGYGYPQGHAPAQVHPQAQAHAQAHGRTPPPPQPATGALGWAYGGLIGRPALGLLWLAPLSLGSFLLLFARFTFLGGLTAMILPGLLVLAGWLTVTKGRTEHRVWHRWNHRYWLLLAYVVVQGCWDLVRYDTQDILLKRGSVSAYQELMGPMAGLLGALLSLGVLALIYVVPAVISRRRRLRAEGL